MARLITRTPWTSQPQTPVGIERTHPLAPTYVFNGGSGPLLFGKQQLLSVARGSGDQFRANKYGLGFKGAQVANGGLDFGAVQPITSDTFTVLVLANPGNGDGVSTLYSQRNGSAPLNQIELVVNSDTSLGSVPGQLACVSLDQGALNSGDKSSATTYTDGNWHVYGATKVGFATINLWFDGLSVALFGTANAQTTSNISSAMRTRIGNIGDYAPSGFGAACDIPLILIFDGKALSASDIAWVSREMLAGRPYWAQPIQRTIWVPAAGGGAFTPAITEAIALADTASQVASLSSSITEAATLSHSQDAIVGYAANITEAMSLSHSQTNVANFPATITEAMTLADSGSVQFGATSTISEAMTLADFSSNVAALSASITESMTLADSPNASASGDFTATQTEAMSLADTASNVAALSRSISEALTLADTASSSAAGDYTATITEAVTLSDSSSNTATLSAAITESATLADTSTASSPGNFAASISESLALAEIASNQAALSAALVEALSLADNAASAWSRVVSLTETMTLSDSASQALNAIVTESVWWSYSVDPQDLHYSVEPQDLTFSITTLALAGG